MQFFLNIKGQSMLGFFISHFLNIDYEYQLRVKNIIFQKETHRNSKILTTGEIEKILFYSQKNIYLKILFKILSK